MNETLLSKNKKRMATVIGSRGAYILTLTETRRLGSSMRVKRAERKPEAIKLARKWVGR